MGTMAKVKASKYQGKAALAILTMVTYIQGEYSVSFMNSINKNEWKLINSLRPRWYHITTTTI